MVVHRQDHRRRWTLVLLVITSFVLITLDERGSGRDRFGAQRRARRGAPDPERGRRRHPAGGRLLRRPRARQRAAKRRTRGCENQNAKLRGELEAGKAAVAENEDLKAALDIPQIEDYDGVVASVVSGSVDNFHRTWRIDKGSSSGIAVDMAVVVGGDTAAALVGRVARVSSNSATIQRIDDRSFSAGAQLMQPDGSGGTDRRGARASRTADCSRSSCSTSPTRGSRSRRVSSCRPRTSARSSRRVSRSAPSSPTCPPAPRPDATHASSRSSTSTPSTSSRCSARHRAG